MTEAGQKWFARALAIMGGGVVATVAIIMAFQEQGLTCKDVDEIVVELTKENSPNLIPFQQVIAPLVGCETTIVPQCSKRPDGTFCRHGMVYGPGIGGVLPQAGKTMEPPRIATCDVVDAEAKNVLVPCVTDGAYDPKTYKASDVDAKALLLKLAMELPGMEAKIAAEAADIQEK